MKRVLTLGIAIALAVAAWADDNQTDNTMQTTSDKFQNAATIEWQYAEPGVERQVMGYDQHLMVVKVRFETGATGARHHHPHSQATYVASGKFSVTIGDDTQVLSAGDGYYVSPDVEHGCECLEVGVLIDTFSPAREDFLKH